MAAMPSIYLRPSISLRVLLTLPLAAETLALSSSTSAPPPYSSVARTATAPADIASLPSSPLAFAFSPAGLLFPYYIGVAYKLRELGLLQPSSPLGGSSAGAIVATALACGITEADVMQRLTELLEDVRAGMRLNRALRKQLEIVLPEDAHIRAQRHGLKIGYLEVLPRPRRHIVTQWTGKQDLIDTIAASCNWCEAPHSAISPASRAM